MPLPTKPYRDWDENDVAHLIEHPPAEESAKLEFKKDSSLLSKDQKAREKAEKDMLKDIASMANAGGGAILLGVDQERRKGAPPVAKELTGISVNDVEDFRKKVFSLVDEHLDVRPPSPILTPVPVRGQPDKRVLIVQVQQNTYSLSMVTMGLNQFWHRRGWNNALMNTEEIQYAFEQMARLRRPAEMELRRIESRVKNGVTGPVAWVAIIPLRRSRDHVPADPDAIKEAMTRGSEWMRCFGKTAKPGCYRHKDYIPFLRGLRICIDQYNILSELHRDGTVLFRMPVWLCEKGSGRPCDDPKDVKLLRLYGAWAGGLCAFRDLASQFGFPSVAIAGAGCIGFTGMQVLPGKRLAFVNEPDS